MKVPRIVHILGIVAAFFHLLRDHQHVSKKKKLPITLKNTHVNNGRHFPSFPAICGHFSSDCCAHFRGRTNFSDEGNPIGIRDYASQPSIQLLGSSLGKKEKRGNPASPANDKNPFDSPLCRSIQATWILSQGLIAHISFVTEAVAASWTRREAASIIPPLL